ncbi:serine/threonine protein kinase (plasmid) [Streptomyces alboflavus]|uniref:non-specific serine/threonine protein kinase n=1 Tax=Streptomyces alboflavus TaxID=67267 RepID=A0A291W4L3_9ACTN|nr:serine/threonine-protein kinase [Streptomyces alboflavus]ATM24581.1 serine/threonine protein kinase [Streptomyces alboflavus]
MPEQRRLVGRYAVHEVLGAGGMGVVHRAFDERLGREVALKVVDLSAAAAVERARFEREARAVARLRSAHVVTVYDAGEDVVDGRRVGFLVMELLDGEPLSAVLTHELPPVEDVVAWGRQLCRGLRDAHAAGVVHRDVKPSNVLLSQGAAVLIDFGIAQLGADVQTLTLPGTVVGTPAYMAPERLRGEAAEAPCDLYALGCVLHELLTGQPPFGRGVARAAGQRPVPVRTVRPQVPAGLEDLVLDLLQERPADRPDATETQRRLAAVAAAAPALAGVVPTERGRSTGQHVPGPARDAATLPSPARTATAVAAGRPEEGGRAAARRAALTGAVVLWGQLAVLTSLPTVWVAVCAAALGLVLSVVSAPSAREEVPTNAVVLTAWCATAGVIVSLAGWSALPWWQVLAVAVVLSPALIALGALAGAVTERLTGADGGEGATAAGMVNAVVLAGFAAGQQPAAVVLLAAAGLWLTTSLAVAVPLSCAHRYRGVHR